MDLTVYQSQYPKKRIGKNNDGGYIIIDVPIQYDFLLGAGISNDISFEEHFLRLFPHLQCHGFDGTINSIHSTNRRFTWIKKNIGTINSDTTDNLHSYLEKYSNVFLKMDIEGHEIPWFECLTDSHMNSIAQMVVEFHYPFSPREEAVMNKIQKTHVMFHIHANNACGTNGRIPNVFECTFVNRRFVTYPCYLNKTPLPTPRLDQKNIPRLPDISLNYPPFVN